MSDVPVTIRDLLSYRLHKAAYYVTKPAYLMYSRDFGVTGSEWRLLGNLYTDGPMSLASASEEADIQLAQASRTIASLVQRGLVKAATDQQDGRSVRLSLTGPGKALYRRLFARAVSSHDELMVHLTKSEQRILFNALEKLARAGRQMLATSTEGVSAKPPVQRKRA